MDAISTATNPRPWTIPDGHQNAPMLWAMEQNVITLGLFATSSESRALLCMSAYYAGGLTTSGIYPDSFGA